VSAIDTGDLIARRSVDVLKNGQSATGALIASPAFPTYHYAWLRDGAFCAHALDTVGERASASAFHDWVVQSVEAHRPMVESAIAAVDAGETPPPEAMPPARYTLDGSLEGADDDPWPNFQIDGYGMWLWALEQHHDGDLSGDGEARTVELVARYLAATWRLKCFNCWEELDGGEHASTLGAVVAGLDAAACLLGDDRWADAAEQVRTRLLERFLRAGRFRRGANDDRVDGSLLWLAVPFGVFPAEDARIAATVETIQHELTGPHGGVYRYRGDTYYGGGEWILLACSLGWHAARVGDTATFERARDWVREQALPNGDLSEQITSFAQEPDMVEPWVRRWGPVATPLLWSHAMYLLMEDAARA
jgi:GH15 family glucan-1,4-alpha-glucosidase